MSSERMLHHLGNLNRQSQAVTPLPAPGAGTAHHMVTLAPLCVSTLFCRVSHPAHTQKYQSRPLGRCRSVLVLPRNPRAPGTQAPQGTRCTVGSRAKAGAPGTETRHDPPPRSLVLAPERWSTWVVTPPLINPSVSRAVLRAAAGSKAGLQCSPLALHALQRPAAGRRFMSAASSAIRFSACSARTHAPHPPPFAPVPACHPSLRFVMNASTGEPGSSARLPRTACLTRSKLRILEPIRALSMLFLS